jgi:hypothetical protein
LPNSRYGGGCVDKGIGKGAASKPYKKHGIGSVDYLQSGSVEDYDVT